MNDSSGLGAPLPDFERLFEEVAQITETSVRSAAMDGVRLGIGFAASSIDVAHATARQHGASSDTLAWLRLLAATLRQASASDELARVFDEEA